MLNCFYVQIFSVYAQVMTILPKYYKIYLLNCITILNTRRYLNAKEDGFHIQKEGCQNCRQYTLLYRISIFQYFMHGKLVGAKNAPRTREVN